MHNVWTNYFLFIEARQNGSILLVEKGEFLVSRKLRFG